MGGKSKKKQPKKQDDEDEIVDKRFLAATNRPQFHRPKKESAKVVLDERFASVLTDSRFQLAEKDKYGRKKKSKQDDAEELDAFYTVEKEDEEEEESDSEKSESSSAEEKDSDDDNESLDPASRIKYLTALSRGELSVSSSSSSSSEESDDDDDSSDENDEHVKEEEHVATGVLDPSCQEEVELTETPSPYLAVMDMDWMHVRAVDLFCILSSFTPPGAVRRVRVFPSNYGLECMAKEAQYGPTNLWKKSESDNQEEEDDEEEDDDDASSNGEEEEEVDPIELQLKQIRLENKAVESDFDPEKLRAYEASKLKYYFAIVEFTTAQHADVCYKEVDGLELEHSSAAMDLRSIPPDELEDVVKDREIRDEATGIPSNYKPPDFVVSALQQSSVQCTWEDGDAERRRKLTGYSAGSGGWAQNDDDLRAYLASDVSSDDDDSDVEEARKDKASNMRKMLGLEGSDDDDAEQQKDDVSSSEDENDFSKEATFIPGETKLEDKIRSKIQSKNTEELTPWQKYQEKRKEKRKERRQARRKQRIKFVDSDDDKRQDDDGMYGSDPEFGKAEFEDEDNRAGGEDDFFSETVGSKGKGYKKKQPKKSDSPEETEKRAPSTKEELELLLAGDNDEEDEKDYDMRGIQRIQKNKNKKLRGSRKRKETELASTVSGKEFKLDTKDSRFAAVLEGTDDRFGIDRTDPNFRETEAMKEILQEQTKRRKAKKRKTAEKIAPNVSATASVESSGGAAALSSLVMSLKSKVAKKSQ